MDGNRTLMPDPMSAEVWSYRLVQLCGLFPDRGPWVHRHGGWDQSLSAVLACSSRCLVLMILCSHLVHFLYSPGGNLSARVDSPPSAGLLSTRSRYAALVGCQIAAQQVWGPGRTCEAGCAADCAQRPCGRCKVCIHLLSVQTVGQVPGPQTGACQLWGPDASSHAARNPWWCPHTDTRDDTAITFCTLTDRVQAHPAPAGCQGSCASCSISAAFDKHGLACDSALGLGQDPTSVTWWRKRPAAGAAVDPVSILSSGLACCRSLPSALLFVDPVQQCSRAARAVWLSLSVVFHTARVRCNCWARPRTHMRMRGCMLGCCLLPGRLQR